MKLLCKSWGYGIKFSNSVFWEHESQSGSGRAVHVPSRGSKFENIKSRRAYILCKTLWKNINFTHYVRIVLQGVEARSKLIFLLVVWDWYNYLWDRLNYDDGTEAVVNTVVSGAESKVATDRWWERRGRGSWPQRKVPRLCWGGSRSGCRRKSQYTSKGSRELW